MCAQPLYVVIHCDSATAKSSALVHLAQQIPVNARSIPLQSRLLDSPSHNTEILK